MAKRHILVPAFFVAAVGITVPAALAVLDRQPAIAQAQDAAPAAVQARTKSEHGPGRLVAVATVLKQPVAQTVPVVGRLVALRAGTVAARIGAPVAEIRVDIGDRVKRGDVLALLVDDSLRLDRKVKAAELAAAEATVTTTKATLALAQQGLERVRELRHSAAFAKATLEDKRLEVARDRTLIAEAEANADKARAALALADTRLSYTRILAPYDGTITRRQSEVGAYVKEGEAMFSMISDRDLEIEAAVPAARIGALAPGAPVTFTLGSGLARATEIPAYDAVVRAIVPEEDMRTRTRTVRFTPRFDERPDGLAANQSVTVHLPLGIGHRALTVPKDAVLTSTGAPTVFVVEDGRAQLRSVNIGEGLGDRFEVRGGLSAGDIVVVRGNERLRDGSRVRVEQTATE